jgi:diguanylate cyclase (GGDEF)-like protein
VSTSPSDGGHALLLERLTAHLVQRLPRRVVLALSAAGIAAVGLLDYAVAVLAGFDFAVTPLYLVPVGFSAWAAGAGSGALFALFAAVVEGTATWASIPGAARPGVVLVSVLLEVMVFVGAAFTIARLRWHLDFERQLSHTDPVTGIGNRRTFEDAALREISRAERRPGPLSVAYFDVDHFKEVNDRHGHAAGDLLLRTLGAALRASVRTMDTVARVGGDEFVLLLPETDAATCRLVVERLRALAGEAALAAGFDNTFSVGAVTFLTPPRSSFEMLSASDRVMYAVKRGPRNGAGYEVVVATGA